MLSEGCRVGDVDAADDILVLKTGGALRLLREVRRRWPAEAVEVAASAPEAGE